MGPGRRESVAAIGITACKSLWRAFEVTPRVKFYRRSKLLSVVKSDASQRNHRRSTRVRCLDDGHRAVVLHRRRGRRRRIIGGEGARVRAHPAAAPMHRSDAAALFQLSAACPRWPKGPSSPRRPETCSTPPSSSASASSSTSTRLAPDGGPREDVWRPARRLAHEPRVERAIERAVVLIHRGIHHQSFHRAARGVRRRPRAPPSHHVRVVVLDLDGTLINTEQLVDEIVGAVILDSIHPSRRLACTTSSKKSAGRARSMPSSRRAELELPITGEAPSSARRRC